MKKEEIASLHTELIARLPEELLIPDHKFRPNSKSKKRSRSTAPFPVDGNIVGIGYGPKITNRKQLEQHAVKIYVRKKLPKSQLTAAQLFPDSINGTPTDVVVSGKFWANAAPDITIDPRQFLRPARPGLSLAHMCGTAGTFGCLVKKSDNPGSDVFVLSANHVLALLNEANIGDIIVQPAPSDGGSADIAVDCVAELSDFDVILLDGPANSMDAAIARLTSAEAAIPSIIMEGQIGGAIVQPTIGLQVEKYGRSTRLTKGQITDCNLATWINYDSGSAAWFEHQIGVVGLAEDFSTDGDSGALVVTSSPGSYPVGMLIADSGNSSAVTPISWILKRFGVSLL